MDIGASAGVRPRRDHEIHAARFASLLTVTDYELNHCLKSISARRSNRSGEELELWGAIATGHRNDFRVVHFKVEPNHIHLLAEAAGKAARARGIQGLKVRMAKRLNRHLGREGELFGERYHSRALKTPREVRNALRYVLNNARHHAAERGELLDAKWIDPYSSAIWFDGWSEEIVVDQPWKRDLLAMSPPTAKPTVWLLTTGWRRHGTIGVDEIPGPKPK